MDSVISCVVRIRFAAILTNCCKNTGADPETLLTGGGGGGGGGGGAQSWSNIFNN